VFPVRSQTKRIDQLRDRLAGETARSKQQTLLLDLCEQYSSLSADSLQQYVNMGLAISKENSNEHFLFRNYYCFYFLKLGDATQSRIYSDSLLRRVSSLKNNEQILLEILANKAIAQVRENQYKEAIETSLKFLEGAEHRKDTLCVLRAYTILGWVNMELDNVPESINWLSKGLQYTDNVQILSNISSLHNNIASCYEHIRQYDSAIHYVNLGLKYSTAVENLGNQANALNIRADIYSKTNKIKKAQQDLEEALIIRGKIGDLPYIIADMGQLSRFYATTHQTDKGISLALEGIKLSRNSNNLYKLIYLNQALAKNYEAASNIPEYAKVLKEIIYLKDSLHEKNSIDAIAEMVTKYELQKKENIIIQQENNLIKNHYFSVGAGIAFILASIIIWLIYRNYTFIQKRKMEFALAEEKIHSSKAVQQAEENERKRIAADLHDNLGSYAAAITSNVRYLKEGRMEPSSLISQLDENAKGIVTQLSDTIWVLKNEQLPITKLADRFKAWTQRMIQNYPDVRYYYEEDIVEDIEFPPVKMLNIFLILKECLNNALKHSRCTTIMIHVSSDHGLCISIADNGKWAEESIAGNGIENIKHRAKECDLMIVWEALEPSGTKVILTSATTN